MKRQPPRLAAHHAEVMQRAASGEKYLTIGMAFNVDASIVGRYVRRFGIRRPCGRRKVIRRTA